MLNNTYLADLHTHTTASDGVLSPSELVQYVKDHGIYTVAITDHDTVGGVEEAFEKGQQIGVKVLCGVEISAGDDGETHILGYGLKENKHLLQTLFQKMQQDRVDRMYKIIDKLRTLQMPLNEKSIREKAKGTLGRPHIARQMVEDGYVLTVQEAFEKWLGNGCPAYVGREKLSVKDAIKYLKSAGFVPVLAHPSLLKVEENVLCALVDAWVKEGLMGIEAFHPMNEAERGCLYYQKLAEKKGLLVTGGSDFHVEHVDKESVDLIATKYTSASYDVAQLEKQIILLNS